MRSSILGSLLRLPAVRLAGHSAAYGSAGVIAKAAALLTVPYLTRELSPTGYGLADLATSLAALLTLLVRFAGEIPAARLLAAAQTQSDRQQVLGAFVAATAGTSVLVALAILPASPVVAAALWSSPNEGTLAAVALALVPVSAVQGALATVQRLLQRPVTFTWLSLIDLFGQLAFAVALVAVGFGPIGVPLGFLIGGLVGMAAAGWVDRHELEWPRGLKLPLRLVGLGLPFLPATAAFFLADAAARVIAANVLTVLDVGQIALAIRLASVMALGAAAFTSAWGPLGLSLSVSEWTAYTYRRTLHTFTLLAVTLSIALGSVGPEIARIVAGPQFSPAAIVLPGLLLAAGLSGSLFVLTTAAGLAQRGFAVASASLVGAGAQLALTVLLIPPLGLAGVGFAAVAGRLLAFALLAPAVASVVRVPIATMLTLSVGGVGVVVLHAINTLPGETIAARAVIGVLALAVGIGGSLWMVFAVRAKGLASESDGRRT